MTTALVRSSADAGHVMAQVAACQRSVGLALARQAGVFELRGRPADLVATAAALGCTHSPARESHPTEWGWWRTQTSFRALVIAAPPRLSELRRLLERVVVPRLDVTVTDLSRQYAGLVLAGPRAARLATSPPARLAASVVTVCDGQDYWLILTARERARDTHRALLEIGRVDGAVAVGAQATALHRAAHRVLITQRTSPKPISDMTRTGERSS